MKRYETTISIHPLSYWLNSGGRGRGLIDNEINFHKTGFPKLRAGTFKGLLRESCLEVLEMNGGSQSLIDLIFGKEGNTSTGRLSFRRDFYLLDWDKIRPHAEAILRQGELSSDAIKNYYTQTIYQTKIEDGVASDNSLRRLGVMLPMVSFQTVVFLDIEEGDKGRVENLLSQGCHNLLHLGTARNRGFGRVRVSMAGLTEVPRLTPQRIACKTLSVHVDNIGVLQLAQHGANPNEIQTDIKIAGNRFRGLLASKYIEGKKRNDQSYDPNDDEDFYDLFLSGKVRYGYAYPQGSIPLPKNIQRTKQGGRLINVFQEKNCISSHAPMLLVDTSEGGHKSVAVDTSMEFNMSRKNNRMAGTSTEEEGAIYYEEVIDEDQSFTGHIYADDPGLIEALTTVVRTDLHGFIGANKSTMGYAHLRMEPKEPETVAGCEFQLIFLAPTVFLNAYGYPQVSRSILEQAIKDIHVDLEIDDAAMAITSSMMDQYVTLWRSFMDKQLTIDSGSTMIIRSEQEITLPSRVFVGMRNEQGMGECLLVPYDASAYTELVEPPGEAYVQPKDVMKVIVSHKRAQDITVAIQTQAISRALSQNSSLSNSAISNILEAFKNANSADKVHSVLIEEKVTHDGKKRTLKHLGKKLDAEGYMKKDETFDFRRWNNKDSFEEQRVFWIQYFQTLRLKS